MALILDGSQQLSLKTPPYVIPNGLSVVFCVQPASESSSYYVLGDYRDSSNTTRKSLSLYGTAYGQGNRPFYQNVPGGSSGLGSENYTSSFPQVPQLISYSWAPVGSNSHHTARASAVFANNVFQSINGYVWSASWGDNFINNADKLYLFKPYSGTGVGLRGKVFWVALVNEFWDNTRSRAIHEALLRQDTHILDTYQNSLIELWDFNDGRNALTGLIAGTKLDIEEGTLSYQPSNVPVSRNTFFGIGQPHALATPAWLSTLDVISGGAETINCTPAAIGTEGQAAGVLASEALQTGSGTLSVGAVSASIVELATIGCTATALSVGGEPCAIHQQQAINCTAADTAVSGQQASIVEAGQDTIACTAAAVSLAAAAAQQVEAGSSTINCTSGALSVTAPAAGMVEAGDSVIGCVSAPLSVGAHAAALVEVGSSTVNCTVGALSVTAPAAGIVEVGDSIIGCSTAALSLSSSQAVVVESGASVIGCAAASLSISGTTASITDSMGVHTAAVVLSTPGCSIHDFDIIGATTADLSVGSSIAGMVEVGEAVIGTGYADIGITATPCALITTDAEPIITNIGLVASINQPSIFASIPNITITAKV